MYTRGRRSRGAELPLGEDFYRAQGIEVIDTDRGGRITYHGPGQLVGYPIMRDRTTCTATCARWKTRSSRRSQRRACERTLAPRRGASTTPACGSRERKIASIGVHVSRGRHHARLRGQRRQRPRAVLLGRRLRPARRDDDLARARARAGRARRACAACASAWRSASAGARPPPAPGHAASPRDRRGAVPQRAPKGAAPSIDSARRSRRARPSATRSRANPGGMDVLQRARPRRAPAARAQAAVVQGAAARRRALPRS